MEDRCNEFPFWFPNSISSINGNGAFQIHRKWFFGACSDIRILDPSQIITLFIHLGHTF